MEAPSPSPEPRKKERRNPFRSSLLIEPPWWRAALAAIAVVVYGFAFIPLYREGGVGVSALSLFPVVILAWLYGAWGGLLAGLLTIPANALLLRTVGEPGWQVVASPGSGSEGSALVVVVGCVVGLLRDLAVRLDHHLTEWRKAERQLRVSEDRYRLLFERSRDPIYLATRDGRIYDANDSMVRFFGYTKAEMLDLDMARLYESDEDLHRFQAQLESRGYVEDFPLRLRTKAGAVRDCLVTATARLGAGREVLEFQGTIRDVTASRALRELADRRTAELQDAVAELESFSYSVSHDLRTHLVTMGGFASILWSEHREALDEKGREYLKRIVEAGGRMDRFVSDLLGYSRVSRTEPSLGLVALGEVVDEALSSLAGPIAARDADVRVRGDLPVVRADRTLLERVVENLLSNAVKFVPGERTPEIRIGARRWGGRVELWVQDNGIGIEEADLGRAFRAFERLHPQDFPGTGVGLSIVQKGMERMGGHSGAESEPGVGSRFWVEMEGAE